MSLRVPWDRAENISENDGFSRAARHEADIVELYDTAVSSPGKLRW